MGSLKRFSFTGSILTREMITVRYSLALSTNCFGSRLNQTFYSAEDISSATKVKVGIEPMPTWFSSVAWLKFMAGITGVPILSVHCPFWTDAFDKQSAGENQKTGPVLGTPGNGRVYRVARELKLPTVIHAVTVIKLFKLGLHAVRRLDGIELRLEQGRGDPYPTTAYGRDDLEAVLQAARMLRWAGIDTLSANWDIGHAAREKFQSGKWDGNPETFMSQVFEPDHAKLADCHLSVTEAHLHNYVPGKGYQGDHMFLSDPDGRIPIKRVVHELMARHPGIHFVYEIAPDLVESAFQSSLGWLTPVRMSKVNRLIGDTEFFLEAAS